MSFRLSAIAFLVILGFPARTFGQEMIRSAAEVQALSIESAAKSIPVRIDGVITYIDGMAGRAYVQDESGGVSIRIAPEMPLPEGLTHGTHVVVEGFTTSGEFLPMVAGEADSPVNIQLIGKGEMPAPRAVNGPQLTLPDIDSQWIETWGVVRPPPAAYRGAVVALEAEGRTFFAYLPEDATVRDLPPSLLGIRVRVRAVAGTLVNELRQMTRRVLFLPSIDFITAEKLLPLEDPFQRPLTAFDDLLRAHTPGPNEKARVRGIMMMALPNEGLFLREPGGGGLWVQTSQGFAEPSVSQGDMVEAVGWPEASDFRPDLRGAVFRVIGSGTPVPPISTTAKELLTSRHHANLIKVEASLIGHVEDSQGIRLLLTAQDLFFDARIPLSVADGRVNEWPRDTRLAITGVCENVPGEGISSPQTSPSFFIRVASMNNIAVISLPPWWNSRRMLWVLGAAVGYALLIGSWAISLRRRVAIQTGVIKAQVHRAGAQEERQRLARELHDSLEQEMTGVGLQLETALARLEGEPDSAKVSIGRARRLLHRAQRETRETIWDLRSSPTDPSVLPGLLQEILTPVTEEAGTELEVNCSQCIPDGLPGTVMHHLVRIAQESVANAVRHGKSKQVRVSVDSHGDTIRLTVTDDGCGFQQTQAPGARQGHFGLTGMRERAAKCDGDLTVTSEPGKGTTIVFTAPIKSQPLS